MLRLACCLSTERAIRVCAPVHDAILVEAPLAELEDTAMAAQRAMATASRVVLAGVELRSDVDLIRWPDRYSDERGRTMWQTVSQLLDEADAGKHEHECTDEPRSAAT